MARAKQHARHHIISVRVNEEERQTLEKLSRELKMNVSDLMREALEFRILFARTA